MATPSQTTLKKRHERAYAFRVLVGGKPKNIPGVEGMKNGLWVFPRDPQSVSYQASARTFTFAQGVTDVGTDEQGVDPPIISISGSFGENGGFDLKSRQGIDGRASQRALEALIRGYLKLVAEDGRKRQPLHSLEWHDVYRDEHWLVTPALVPYGQEDAGRPYAEGYQLRLTALRRTADKLPPKDPIKQKLGDKFNACPLNPRCRYGGPSVKGCPFAGGKK